MAQTTSSHGDVEKEADQHLIPSSVSDATTANAATAHAINGTQTSADPFESLRIFQELVGIRSSKQILKKPTKKDNKNNKDDGDDSADTKDGYVNRPNPLQGRHNWHFKSLFTTSSPANDGYYVSAIQSEWKAYIGYQLSNAFITTVYVLQIFVAATITALAAYEGHRVALTTLGAINTILAGLVAYTKGMGLPNRLRKSRDQFQHVKEYVDYKERQFVWKAKFQGKAIPEDSSLATLDPWVEAEQVRKLYEAAQKDEQANYPDIYVNENERGVLEAINADNREGRNLSMKKANK
jgi:hypothetical protein